MRRSSTDPVQHMFGYIFGREKYGDSYKVSSYSYTYIDSVPKDISVDYYIPHSLRNVVIADCEYIPIRAFDGCGSIRNITIPDNVIIIDNFAFNDCGITSINFPYGLTSIGNRAFYDCTAEEWKNIEFGNDKANPGYYAKNFYVLDEKGNMEFNGKHYTFTMLN